MGSESAAAANFKNFKDAAAHTDILMGTAISYWHMNDEKYHKVAVENYDLVTAESVCKMIFIGKVKGKYDFTGCDAVAKFAKDNGMKMRGHTLIWAKDGSWIPSWLRWEKRAWVIEDYMKTYI